MPAPSVPFHTRLLAHLRKGGGTPPRAIPAGTYSPASISGPGPRHPRPPGSQLILLAVVLLAAAGFVGTTVWQHQRQVARISAELEIVRSRLADDGRAQADLLTARHTAVLRLSEEYDVLRQQLTRLEATRAEQDTATLAALRTLRESLAAGSAETTRIAAALDRLADSLESRSSNLARDVAALREEIAGLRTATHATTSPASSAQQQAADPTLDGRNSAFTLPTLDGPP